MKKIMKPVAGVFFAIFGVAVIALLMSYTFEALAYLFPGKFISQMMGMILFDIAALAWLGAFIYLSQSIMQYAFSFIGFAFGLLGSLGMVAIDVMLGGQEMIKPPEWINSALVYGFIAAAVIHVVLYYAYKLAGPEVSADISLGIETAQITEEAMKQAENELLRERGALGRTIAPRLMNNVKRNLGLPVSGDVIDLPAYDVNDLRHSTSVHIPAARKMSFAERLKAAAQVLVKPEPTARAYQATANWKPIPSPIQTPDVKPTAPTDTPRYIPKEERKPDLSAVSPERQRALNTPDGEFGHTVGDVAAKGLCGCPVEVFDPNGPAYSEELQSLLADVTKGNGIACMGMGRTRELWLDESLCAACPFFKGDRVFPGGVAGGE